MRPLFTLTLFVCLLQSAQATDYYFSSSSGDDSRSASQARNSSTPWKSISKLNAIFASLQPGDRVLLKRGDTFYGSIKVAKSGTSSAPIVIGAYGSGDKPVVTGLVTLSGWSSLGSGRYEADNSSLGATLNMVTLNGEAKALGRFPNSNATNKGYLSYESVGSGYIKDNELQSSPNWEGAELVIRTTHWTIDRTKVTDHAGSVLRYSPATSSTPRKGYGYFFQNHVRTLDQLGEWAYKASTKKVTMYFGSSSPSNYKVKAATVADLVYLRGFSHLVFDNLAFEGANQYIFYVYGSTNTRIQNCDLDLAGVTGVLAWNTTALKVENCRITNSHNTGIDLYSNTDNTIIRGNDISHSGVFAGMAPSGNHTYYGVRANGNNNLIEYNTIEYSGYCGVRFTGDGTTIKNNFITHFSFVKDDGGGIYTGSSTQEEAYNRKITGNIILNGIGAREGTDAKYVQQVSGIYLDNNSSGVSITGNTVANCGKVGLYIHNAFKVQISGNTIFNNTGQVMLNHDDITKAKVRNINMKNNIFFSKKADQPVAYFYTKLNDIAYFGDIDENHYVRPLDDNQTITAITGLYTGTTQKIYNHTLSTWKPAYGHDPASKKSPKTLSSGSNPDSYIRFVYNASTSNKSFDLSGTYIDARNKSYSGSITLAPYTSAVLIKTGTSTETSTSSTAPTVSLTSPKAYATYSAPASVRITATASDADGSVTKVEFYKGTTLLKTETTAPYDWTWSNVAAGTYSITAKAYDNSGKTTTSTAVKITVGSSSLVSGTTPTASAAPTVKLTSPKAHATFSSGTSVRVTAAANDADGSVTKVEFYVGNMLLKTENHAPYEWTYDNVPAGKYVLTAKAYDNSGKVTTSAPVSVTVKSKSGNLSVVNSNQSMMSMDTEAVAKEMKRSSAGVTAFDFSLYPNPAVSKVFVLFKGTAGSEKANLVIRTIAGAVVKQQSVALQGSGVEVDVTTLAPGTYIISLSTETTQLSKKLIKVD